MLTRLEDVTAQVTASVGDAIGPASNEKRKAVLTRLEQACEEGYRTRSDPHSCEAVTLYGGGQYFLYHYKRYDDVRLVAAPENEVAFFGGDVDNFEFPRWNLDFGLLRVYEDGKPAATPDFLHCPPRRRRRRRARIRDRPSRQHAAPRYSRAAALRARPGAQSLAAARAGDARPLPAIRDPRRGARAHRREESVLRRKQPEGPPQPDERAARRGLSRNQGQEEQALRNAVTADPRLKSYASAWSDIEKALDVYRNFYDRHVFIELGAALQGDLANYARTLVRAAVEREKPNESRQREYTEAALPLLRQQTLAPQPVYPDLEILRLTYSLEKMAEFLGVDDPTVHLALGRDSPRNLATRLVRETKLGDAAFREQLWNGGRAALEKSGDPMIALALRMDPEAQQIRKRYEDEVEAPVLASEEKIARARFAIKGKSAYPDATFTLRLTYGSVEGWREGDREVLPFTTMEGLFARATGQPPFRLPARWVQAQDRINLDTRFNFTTNNDIIGGNSGSPVVDARGRLVGLIFDGNIHSIGGDLWFDPAMNRAIAVHPAALVLGLGEVYGAGNLLREMAIE